MRKSLIALLVCLFLFIGGSVALGQGFAGWFDIEPDTRIHRQLWVNGNVTMDGDITLGDDLTLDDITADVVTGADLVATDDTTVGDDLNIADLIASTYTTITVTEGGTITPVGMYQRLTAAGAVGTSSIANPSAGRLVMFVNVGSNTITLTDTGTLKLTGNIALGQFDSLTVLGDGTNWVQLATANN